jgi:hypothetical protein
MPSTHQVERNSGGTVLVPMVQSTYLWQFHYFPKVGRVNCSWHRRIFPKGQMSS